MTLPCPGHVEGVVERTFQDDSDPLLFINENHSRPTDNDLPTIYITSYGHRIGPLLPTPNLTFDLRALPNPPKNVRTGHTGLSKPLRDAFFADQRVQQRFHEICGRIRSAAEETSAGRSGVRELRVGVCCELGKHRSVALVEELRRVPFEGWNVAVDHRDVHRKSPSKKSGRFHSRRDYADSSNEFRDAYTSNR